MKFEKEELFTTDSDSIEDFLEAEYGHRPSFMQIEELQCGASIRYDVVKGASLDITRIKKFRKDGTESYGLIGELLNDLCDQGKMQPGKYLITCNTEY